ncbi:4-hydroxy-tetrahydrodipicolinate reductase [Varunaivibrio sulfuroxidans]|uniref:4-hydroxy-tetrahydrodipicolinate reductase n=1 Tax=Varunaivibrio sulfuroxidans TaxID=1773489 RepID=A0A4R3JHS8_9PROT|nr:4-hydroxy-tetrahydrodipicolinate reductase [Varunaivibrio sulfuroxidans]TCS64913.1 dihydrodipicolinate reductase [Varunaivibrio sulfuroxidans]WES29793.1 4-hydroxy-tetrahydrodipicolinate reductase [Varunaivibrio sulfuroxidans]
MKIGIVGAAGRMGRMLVEVCLETEGADLIGGVDRADHPELGADLGALAGRGEIGAPLGADSEALFAAADVVIDFTFPEATARHGAMAAALGAALVVGTTGLDPDQQRAIDDAARRVAVLQAANYSLGVNLLQGLVAQTAAVLGPEFDIEIVEMHHRHKVDAPSGTALALGRSAAKGRGVDLDRVADKVRDGIVGPRQSGHIGFATLRGGDVVGDHSVIFAGDGERIELTHKASARTVFARGAVQGAMWCAAQRPGLYSMAHVLGFK